MVHAELNCAPLDVEARARIGSEQGENWGSDHLGERQALRSKGLQRYRRGTGDTSAGERPPARYFWLLVLFLLLEYARPSGIVQLKLQMLIVLAFPIIWVRAPGRAWHRILGAQVAFFALCAAATPFASNWFASYFTTRTMFGNLSIALAMSWLLSWRHWLVRGIWIWVGIMTYVALFSIAHGGVGPGGFLGDENDLALACSTALPFAYFGFEQLPGWRRWASGAVGLVMVIATVVSFSRGGFVALVAVALYCFLSSGHKVRNLVVSVASIGAFLLFAPAKYVEEIKTIRNTNQGTAQVRQFLWATAWNMWKDYPVLGVGGGNFNYLAGFYQPTDDPRFQAREYIERNWAGQAVHSLIFQTLAEQGAVGLALVSYLGVAHVRLIRRLRQDIRRAPRTTKTLQRDADIYAAGLSAAMVGYGVAGLFLSVLYYPYLWYFSALAVAADAALRREMRAAVSPRSNASTEQAARR